MIRFAISVIFVATVLGALMPSHRPFARGGSASGEARKAAVARATDPALDTVLERKPDGHFYADAMVDDAAIRFVVDTGASMVALTEEDAREAGVPFDPANYEVVARGASGDVKGQVVRIHHLAIGQKEAWDVDAAVIANGLDISLLGQSYLSQIGSVSIANDRMTLR